MTQPGNNPAGNSTPNWAPGYVPSAYEWNAWWRSKLDFPATFGAAGYAYTLNGAVSWVPLIPTSALTGPLPGGAALPASAIVAALGFTPYGSASAIPTSQLTGNLPGGANLPPSAIINAFGSPTGYAFFNGSGAVTFGTGVVSSLLDAIVAPAGGTGAITSANNGQLVSSASAGGPATYTLPTTAGLAQGFTVGFMRRANNVTINTNAISGGTILAPSGQSLTSLALAAVDYETVILAYLGGAAWVILHATPLTASAAGMFNSGVSAGSYSAASITVGADGRLTSASSGSAGGDLSGALASPRVAGIQGIPVSSTMPTSGQVLTYASGTGYVPSAPAGNAPYFLAYLGNIQTISGTGATKVAFNTSVVDTASGFSTANYRWTPGTAGRYQISAKLNITQAAAGNGTITLSIYKNGSLYYSYGFNGDSTAGVTGDVALPPFFVQLGATDYVELWSACTNVGGGGYTVNAGPGGDPPYTSVFFGSYLGSS